jgi:hypothetical protein
MSYIVILTSLQTISSINYEYNERNLINICYYKLEKKNSNCI